MCVSRSILFEWAWKDSGEYSTEVHDLQDTVKPVLSL